MRRTYVVVVEVEVVRSTVATVEVLVLVIEKQSRDY